MVELVDTQDLKSCGHCGRAGSSPAPGTIQEPKVHFNWSWAYFLKLRIKSSTSGTPPW